MGSSIDGGAAVVAFTLQRFVVDVICCYCGFHSSKICYESACICILTAYLFASFSSAESNEESFNYRGFFEDRVEEKKKSHVYRRFKTISRLAGSPSRALTYTGKAAYSAVDDVLLSVTAGLKTQADANKEFPKDVADLMVEIVKHSNAVDKSQVVWCNNDYLGMSRNPLIKQIAM